jgi:hypothetical protein
VRTPAAAIAAHRGGTDAGFLAFAAVDVNDKGGAHVYGAVFDNVRVYHNANVHRSRRVVQRRPGG